MKEPRKFRGMPVREGTGCLRVQPTSEDIANAVRGDPQHCAYAECLRRTLPAKHVYIYKTIAYVEVLDEQGNRVFERYELKKFARKYVDDFDQGKGVGPGGFILHPPRASQTLDVKMSRDRHDHKISGERRIRREPPREHGIEFFRNGSGMVKFIGKGKLTTHANP